MMPSIRPAAPTDANAIAELICGASEGSFLPEFSESGRLRFLSDHTAEAMTARLQSGDFQYDVAEVNGLLVGVVGVRRKSHLFSLFVADKMQKQGLGRLLWKHAKARAVETAGPAEFTVNASRNAVAVYEHFGFVAEGPVVDSGGVLYVPMRLRVSHPHFVILYRWRLHPGREDAFVEAWSRISQSLRSKRGSLGSRLHRGDDGLWYSYAQWPSAAARQEAFAAGPIDEQSAAQMEHAVAERYPEIVLECVSDFLVSI
jgi:GNAT superfamily N-acetyltransferase/heme-degrading monooxygenase HmoA